MSLKLKVLGLGLLAMMATSAFAAVNASALVGGHFTAEPAAGDHHVIVRGAESRVSGTHALSFQEINANTETISTPIQCTTAAYHGTISGAAATTTQAVQVRPVYTNCSTNATAPHNVSVIVPENCGTNVFELRSGGNGTVKLNCTITIKHPNCEITVPSGQTLSGITYVTQAGVNPHALTMNVNVRHITGQYHGGFCVFLGTPHVFEMTGSVTVWGENTLGGLVGITHT